MTLRRRHIEIGQIGTSPAQYDGLVREAQPAS